jgi:diguanylate cyclase (GGDEF)-like protein
MAEDRAVNPVNATKNTGTVRLGPMFTAAGMWAFSIGTSIGWGSFIVTCNTYLLKSGILGTAFGLLLGMMVVLVVTWNIQYMIRTAPNAGGVYTFERNVGGKDLGFLAFWFILLTYMAILWANITSVPLFTRFFLGRAFQFGFHYSIFGYEVWFGEALLSIVSILLIYLLCVRKPHHINRVMIIAAFAFAIAFLVCAVLALAMHDRSFSFEPLYVDEAGDFAQIVRIAAISPWAFIGFENITHFSEEYKFPVRKVKGILISSVLVTTVMYLAVCLLSVSAYPPEYESWLAYIRDMGNLEGIKAVPAFYSVNHYLGQAGVVVLMLALFCVIFTSLIGNLLAVSRLLYAVGREGEAPEMLSELSGQGIPRNAMFAVVVVSAFIPFLGRTAIGWIVDVTTLGATLIYGIASHAVYLHAKKEGRRLEIMTGIIGLALMSFFMVLLLVPGILTFDAMATESYSLFIVWSVVGLIYYRRLIRADAERGYGQRIVVWVILLVLVLFASMMWVSRATQNAANDAVERIYQYHRHSASTQDEVTEEERSIFLHEQAKQISKTNSLYTMVSLGLFVLTTIIMLNNYSETRVLGKRLYVAEEDAKTAKRIAELKESISSLLDNMPVMSFSKDARTGVYLACNQAYADFANKETPSGVVGLTDDELFNEATAISFVTNDKKALSMDKPYIFYEEVNDAVGNIRQLRTTKLKFYDANGRKCLLGMSMDMTEMEEIRKVNEQTQAAYNEVLSARAIYESMVDALSEDYYDLYYVDLVTEEYIEYGSRTEAGHRSTELHGTKFFENSKKNALDLVYKADIRDFLNTISKEKLLDSIKKYGTFVYYYRLMIKDAPIYVGMKATRIAGDDRHIIIGINNVDTMMKDRKAAERAREDRRTYQRLNALNNNLIVMYIIDLEDGQYKEFRATEAYEGLGLAKEGYDFFASTYQNSLNTVYPEDQKLFHSQVTKKNILDIIDKKGIFILDYRLVLEESPIYVSLKAAKIEEDGKQKLIVGLLDIDSQVRHEIEYANDLHEAKTMAIKDELTGVKNKHAYVDFEMGLTGQIEAGEKPEFAVVICDINDLKRINDTQGHRAGDAYIRKACAIICNVFKHSPVFRIGGDEFAVLCQGHDYEHLEGLIEEMHGINADNRAKGDVQIACGFSRFDNDQSVEQVFERADQMMYEQKAWLKKQ